MTRSAITYALLLALALAWVGLIFAAPGLVAARHYAAGAVIYGSLSVVCHQLPERSFYWSGFPLAVCARCLGIYAGFLVGLLAYPVTRGLSERAFPWRGWLILAALPTAIDFAGGAAGVFANTATSRLLTGLAAGAGAAYFILPGMLAIAGKPKYRVAEPEKSPSPHLQ